MSERFELSCCLFNESDMDFIRDKKTNKEYVVLDELVPILNQQDQRIAELEEQLKNAIVPKFKVGQTIWYIYGKNIKSFTISKIEVEIRINPLIAYSSPYIYQYEENCFATKEEAQAKLKELGES